MKKILTLLSFGVAIITATLPQTTLSQTIKVKDFDDTIKITPIYEITNTSTKKEALQEISKILSNAAKNPNTSNFGFELSIVKNKDEIFTEKNKYKKINFQFMDIL